MSFFTNSHSFQIHNAEMNNAQGDMTVNRNIDNRSGGHNFSGQTTYNTREDTYSDSVNSGNISGNGKSAQGSATHVALPPGIYYVRSSEPTPRSIVSPNSDGSKLYVATNSTAINQQFLVNGVGVFTSMDSASHAFAVWPSSVTTPVNRSSSSMQWIINVNRNANETFIGYIMSSDTNNNYWGLNGNNVELEAAPYNWTFVPI